MDEPIRLDRRSFLAWASSAAWLAAHGGAAAGSPAPAAPSAKPEHLAPRILSLELLTAAPLAAMREFYGRTLGLQVVEDRRERLTIAAGATTVTFVPAGSAAGKPFYHFAFNIPENKILAALKWQRERGALMPIPERLQDPSYPEEVVDFRHWNAHSIFFPDPGGNVVEYIARHDLRNAAPGGFSTADILYASEIAWIVDDVAAMAAKLREAVGVDQYRGGDDQFVAMGDEQGLLLVMKRGRTLNFNPADEEKRARVFRTAARVRGVGPANLLFPGFPYEISGAG